MDDEGNKFIEKTIERAIEREVQKRLKSGEYFTQEQVVEAVCKENRELLELYGSRLANAALTEIIEEQLKSAKQDPDRNKR